MLYEVITLVLYLKGNWPMREVVPSLVIIAIIWYFSYMILHELSHAAGLYLVGGKAIDYRLIPRFWLGEFGGGAAWITPSGIPLRWQQLTFHAFPYLVDIICLIFSLLIFKKGFLGNAFFTGLTFRITSYNVCYTKLLRGGYEATKFIRADRKNQKLPIIAMTAHAMQGVEAECKAAGMNDYVSKPIDPQNLFSTILKWVKPKPAASGAARITSYNVCYTKLLRAGCENHGEKRLRYQY